MTELIEYPKGDKKLLVLGAGHSRFMRVKVEDEGKPLKGENFEDNFKAENITTLDINPVCNPTVVWDLEKFPWPLPSDKFDELHAYEVLEHLGRMGDQDFFFALWKEIWRVLKPGGLVAATTPWWESVWAWQDPGHKRVYSVELLTYLSQSEYKRQLGKTSMTDYRSSHWQAPYNFLLRYYQMVGADPNQPPDPKIAGLSFVLEKSVYEDRD